MTKNPFTISRTATLAEAHVLMRDHRIRHLPVLDDGALCGVISDRDLHLIETLADTFPNTTLVEEAMTENPFVVTSDMPLDDVAEIMGEHKYGCAVVMGRDGVEGILTATDVCLALAQLLREAVREDLMTEGDREDFLRDKGGGGVEREDLVHPGP